jgi:putative hydrolase of HD superfamily
MEGVRSFLGFAETLKHLKRTGWTRFPIPEVETVSGHMYRMALSVFLLPADVDHFKVMKMALVHDLGESIVGDITPDDPVTPEEKHAREASAMATICSYLPTWSASEVLALWQEYEANQSATAVLVKDLDKFDMVLQAFEYERRYNVDLSTFFESTRGRFRSPVVSAWAEDVFGQRTAEQQRSA